MLDVPPGEQGAAMTRGSWGGSAAPSPPSSSMYPTELKKKKAHQPPLFPARKKARIDDLNADTLTSLELSQQWCAPGRDASGELQDLLLDKAI